MTAVLRSRGCAPQPVGSAGATGQSIRVDESGGQAVGLRAQWGASHITSRFLVICSNQPAYFMSCLPMPDK